MKYTIRALLPIVITLIICAFFTRAFTLKSRADYYYRQSAEHSIRSLAASARFDIPAAEIEYKIACMMSDTGDSIRHRILHLRAKD